MSGNGGNKGAVFAKLDLAVAITSTNFSTHGMHEQTDNLFDGLPSGGSSVASQYL